MSDDIVVGIDLGTTNSAIAIWRNKNLEIVPDRFGNRTIPSCVAFTNHYKYVGKEAKKQIEINPYHTYYEVKRLIGRKYDDQIVQMERQFLTYEIDQDDQQNVILKSTLTNKKQTYTPEEISAIILMELKHMAEEYLKTEVTKAVITVPAYFNDAQRQATKDAATIAGLNCLRIINEPTSAALAYGLEKASVHKGQDINIMVYDLGGGTLDVSILNISDGVFHVLGSAGNSHLGGADFDNRLISHCLSEFKKKHKLQNLEDLSPISFQKLKQSCEEAKKRLSETKKTVIAVKEFYNNLNLLIQITREDFEKICKDILILCLKSVDDILKACDMDKKLIDEIILVGGCTRIPAIRNNLKTFFNGKEPNSSINPDEVVAAGAAIQGYIMSHESDPFSENVVLLDIIPLSLGVETIGGVMNVIIPRNSVIPITRKKKYTTDSDYETSVNIKVYEGERKMTKDNFKVGEFELCDIESAPRGISQIEITFSIDINGIINVTAVDLRGNNTKSISINSNKGRLSPEKIKELVEEARLAESKDKMEKEKKQLCYEIEDLCSNIKININNPDFKLKENDKIIVMEDINKIFDWLKEKGYYERNRKEFMNILKKIKKKYGTLILKASGDLDDVKGSNTAELGTTIFGGDDDENNNCLYEEIENEELGIKNADDEIKKEVKRLREILIGLCHNVFEILACNTIKLMEDDINSMKEYIDDILLWIHVGEKISISEYSQKIDEVNKTCNEIVEKNEQVFNDMCSNGLSLKEELEQLCYMLMGSIISNHLSLQDENTEILKTKVDEILDWLIDLDIQFKNDETVSIDNQMYQDKIDELNSICTKIYNSMHNINFAHGHIVESI